MANLFSLEHGKVNQFIGVLAQAGLTAEQAEEIRLNPSLAARMVAALTAVVVVAFKVTVDYGKSLAEMISAGRYDWTNQDITAEHFPTEGKGTVEVELQYVHLNRSATTAQVLAEMEKLGLRPATLPELLAFGAANPEEQRKYWIVALGSSWVDGDDRGVPVLSGDDARRSLNLGWDGPQSGWGGDRRFLAARK
jgi:hypothetical protein